MRYLALPELERLNALLSSIDCDDGSRIYGRLEAYSCIAVGHISDDIMIAMAPSANARTFLIRQVRRLVRTRSCGDRLWNGSMGAATPMISHSEAVLLNYHPRGNPRRRRRRLPRADITPPRQRR